MEQLLESIRAAVAAGATDEAKAAGATACRTILIALEAKPGEAMAAPVAVAAQSPDIGAIVAGLKGVPVDQLLDLAIAKLRTLVPAEPTVAAPVQKLAIPLVPVPRR